MKGRRRLACLLLAAACRKVSDAPAADGARPEPTSETPTPVRVTQVEKRTVSVVVSAPGRTAALVQQKVKAPFTGTLTELRVLDGDRVQRGQVLGTVVARESEAALSGAREMLRQAATPAERIDAERALALAEKNLVRKPLVAAWAGSVLSHVASAGDRVAEDQEILTIDDASSIVFLADVSQADLARVRPGQRAELSFGGRPQPVPATVHAVMPGANPADFTGPVRLDLRNAARDLPIGSFGTARIVVGEHPDAVTVPDAAVLRDDVTGVSRIALVTRNHAHWVDVGVGLREGGRTEIVTPPLSVGQTVIVSGLVGLPEGKLVGVQP